MGKIVSGTLQTLAVFVILSCSACAEGHGSVFFLDNQNRDFFTHQRSDVSEETYSMSLPEVGAAVSVLLGFPPPATLTASSSSRLDRILVPNPFQRPQAVFMLEIRGVKEYLPVSSSDHIFTSAVRAEIPPPGFSKADVILPDEGEVSVLSLNELFRSGDDKYLDDKDVIDFASWLGGSYSMDAERLLSGELSVPLSDGTNLKLHMFKNDDRELVFRVMNLVHSIRSAIGIHELSAKRARRPAQLVSGIYEGTRGLQDKHGHELFLSAFSKIFSKLQATFKGHLAGVVLFNHGASSADGAVLNVEFTGGRLFRAVVEIDGPDNSTVATEVLMVRRTLAWLTGLILLIATLLGTYFLLYMPLTRDTLLYSNVKLD